MRRSRPALPPSNLLKLLEQLPANQRQTMRLLYRDRGDDDMVLHAHAVAEIPAANLNDGAQLFRCARSGWRRSLMILEIAQFDIGLHDARAFEEAYARATHVIARAKGHLGHEMHRSVDRPGRYVLLVRWRTREDHTVGFRESDLFRDWRALLQPYFVAAPVVDHVEVLQEASSTVPPIEDRRP